MIIVCSSLHRIKATLKVKKERRAFLKALEDKNQMLIEAKSKAENENKSNDNNSSEDRKLNQEQSKKNF